MSKSRCVKCGGAFMVDDDLLMVEPVCDDCLDEEESVVFSGGPTGHGDDLCYSDADPGL